MITGYSEIMRDLPGENTPENVQIIIDEAKRLTELVNDLLDVSKMQSGTQALVKEYFNLTALISATLERYNKMKQQDHCILLEGLGIAFMLWYAFYCLIIRQMFLYSRIG